MLSSHLLKGLERNGKDTTFDPKILYFRILDKNKLTNSELVGFANSHISLNEWKKSNW